MRKSPVNQEFINCKRILTGRNSITLMGCVSPQPIKMCKDTVVNSLYTGQSVTNDSQSNRCCFIPLKIYIPKAAGKDVSFYWVKRRKTLVAN